MDNGLLDKIEEIPVRDHYMDSERKMAY